MCVLFFFTQKTAYEMRISDWSSDVCSSDLIAIARTDHVLDADIGVAVAARSGSQVDRHPGRGTGVGDSIRPGAADHRGIGGIDHDGEIGRALCRERVCQYV